MNITAPTTAGRAGRAARLAALVLCAVACERRDAAAPDPAAPRPTPPAASAPPRVRPAPHAVRGRIVDALGQPVPGCELLAFESRPIGWATDEATSVARARSEPDGRFRLEAPGPGELLLLLRHDRFPPRVLDALAGHDVGEIELASALGVIVDVSRATPPGPVADARVTAEPVLVDPRFASATAFRRTARTAADGRAHLYALSAGSYRIRVEAQGLATIEVVHVQRPALLRPPTVPVRLPDGHRLEGRVVDASGRGVADARVEAVPELGGHPITSVRCGADGGFRAVGLHSGLHKITATDSRGWRAAVDVSIPVAEPLRLRFAEPSALRGRTVDAGTGEGLAGVAVRARRAGDPAALGPATTDAAGAFLLEDLPPGRYVVETSSDRHLGLRTGPVDLPARGDLELALEPARALAGTVRDPEGRPLPAAEVRVMSESFDGSAFRTTLLELERAERAAAGVVRTADDGSFRVLGPLGPCRLLVTSPGFAPRLTEPLAEDVDRAGELWLSRGGIVRGLLRIPASSIGPNPRVCADPLPAAGGPRTAASARVEPDGSFELGPLSAGPYELFYYSADRDRPAGALVRDRKATAYPIDVEEGPPQRHDIQIRAR